MPHSFPHFSEAYRQRWKDAGLWLGATLHGGFDEAVAAQPDKVVFITADKRYSLSEFKADSDALAAGLLGAGIGQGDIVAVQLPNWIEFCLLQIALSRIGAVVQPIHTVFRERETWNLLSSCDSDAIVIPERYKEFSFADMVRSLMPRLPALRKIILARGGADVRAGESRLDDLIAEGRQNLQRLASVAPTADDVYYLNFTSGTEGTPKGFLHVHDAVVSIHKRLIKLLPADTVMLTCSPMTHTFGHFEMYYTYLGGLPMVLVDRYDPTEILEQIQRERVTKLSGTPAHFFGLLHHRDFGKYDTSSVKSVAVGGARSSPDLIADLGRVWGVKSANTYGMGETIIHTRTVPDDPAEKVRTTVGRPIHGVELKIVDQQNRAAIQPAGQIGEICFRGPTLFVGYHNQADKTAATRDQEGWFYTGDLGYVDEEGYLHYVGRAKEVINRGGSKIHPKEIEDLLVQHPAIDLAAVVGMPDERLGERVCAYVVTRDGREVGVDELRDFLAQRSVTRYMHPEVVVRLDEMPMTPTGKIQKVTLQQDAANRAGQAQTGSSPPSAGDRDRPGKETK